MWPASAGPPIFSSGNLLFRCFAAISKNSKNCSSVPPHIRGRPVFRQSTSMSGSFQISQYLMFHSKPSAQPRL